MQLANLFAHAHSDTFRHVQETLDIPLSDGPPPSSSTYDLCMVVPLQRKELSMEMTHVLERVITALGRKYVYMYNADDDTCRYVLLRGGSSRLRAKAEDTGMALLLDPLECQRAALAGLPDHNIAPIKIAHNPDLNPMRPYECLYARYINRDPETEALYMKVNDGGTALFQKADRIRLLVAMLSDSEAEGGAGINTSRLLSSAALSAFFPLHSELPRGEGSFYADVAALSPPWRKPLDEMSDYFGSRVAMHLALQSHLCLWLLVPAAVGAAFQASAVSTSGYSRPEAFAFSFFIALWGVAVQATWRRQQQRLALRWNDTEDGEAGLGGGGGGGGDGGGGSELGSRAGRVRAEFQGVSVEHSHVDGRRTVYYDPSSRLRGLGLGLSSLLVALLAVLGVLAAIYVIRWLLYRGTSVGSYSQFVSSGLNALSVTVLGWGFRGVASALTFAENLRTEGEYEVRVGVGVGVGVGCWG